jgi:hypothetical protein
MDAHANADRLVSWPRVRHERQLHLDGRGGAGTRRGEHGEERVALGVDFLAVVRRQHPTEKPVVIRQDTRVRVSEPLKHRGGTLDVSEEEGERLRGQGLGFPCDLNTACAGREGYRPL